MGIQEVRNNPNNTSSKEPPIPIKSPHSALHIVLPTSHHWKEKSDSKMAKLTDLPSEVLQQIFTYQHLYTTSFDCTRGCVYGKLGQGLESILPNRLVCHTWSCIVDDMDEVMLEKQLTELGPIHRKLRYVPMEKRDSRLFMVEAIMEQIERLIVQKKKARLRLRLNARLKFPEELVTAVVLEDHVPMDESHAKD